MEKPIRHAVSVVIKNEREETLFVLRSPDATSFPDIWSLPSHFVENNENFEDTVRRIGEHKLGVKLEAERLLNEGKSDRENFTLFMHDFQGRIVGGNLCLNSENYTELKWAEPHKQLESMNIMGDCCRLYKEYLGAEK